MAEEFVEFLEELKKESIEDQVKKLREVISKLFNLVEKVINSYVTDFELINNKINSLEEQINFKAQPSPITPNLPVLNPPTVPKVNIIKENVRGAIMCELKDVFKKKK